MTFTQHQKFLLADKKHYCSDYLKILYPKLSGKYFYNSNFVLKSFQFFNQSSKTQKMYFPLGSYTIASHIWFSSEKRRTVCVKLQAEPEYFLSSNSFKIPTNVLPHGLINPMKNFTYSINKTSTAKRQRFISHSLKGILLVNFPEKEKNFLIKNLAAENKIPLITQSASLLLKDSRNMDDLLGVDDPIQILFDKVKTCIPCICFINNLDRIGKQRYEQEQKSLHWLNNSISLLINHNFTDQQALKTINKKNDLQTTALSNKAFVFNYKFQEIEVFKNLKTSQIITLKNVKNRKQRVLKFLTWYDRRPNKNQLEPIKPFFNLLISLSLWSKDSMYRNTNKQSFIQPLIPIVKNSRTLKQKLTSLFSSSAYSFTSSLLASQEDKIGKAMRWDPNKNTDLSMFKDIISFNTKVTFNDAYYHRLPFWLFKINLPHNYKISVARVKLFGFYSHLYKKKEKNMLPSVFWFTANKQLQTNIYQTLSSKTKPIFEKPEYPMIGPQTSIENTYANYNKSILKNSLMKSDNIESFKNQSELFSETNTDSVTSLKNQLGFQDLGKIAINKKKLSMIASVYSRENRNQSDSAYGFTLSEAMGQYPILNKKAGFSLPFESSKNKINQNRDAYFSFMEKDKRLVEEPKLSPNLGERNKNNNSFKMTETDIIKRTALLKFLQILDGFHTSTERKKSVFFPYLRFGLFKKFNLSEILLTLSASAFGSTSGLISSGSARGFTPIEAMGQYPKEEKMYEAIGRDTNKIKPKPFQVNIDNNNKPSLFRKNFLVSTFSNKLVLKTSLNKNAPIVLQKELRLRLPFNSKSSLSRLHLSSHSKSFSEKKKQSRRSDGVGSKKKQDVRSDGVGPQKNSNTIIVNSIENNLWFPYGVFLGWTRLPKTNKFNLRNSSNTSFLWSFSPNKKKSKITAISYLSIWNKNLFLSASKNHFQAQNRLLVINGFGHRGLLYKPRCAFMFKDMFVNPNAFFLDYTLPWKKTERFLPLFKRALQNMFVRQTYSHLDFPLIKKQASLLPIVKTDKAKKPENPKVLYYRPEFQYQQSLLSGSAYRFTSSLFASRKDKIGLLASRKDKIGLLASRKDKIGLLASRKDKIGLLASRKDKIGLLASRDDKIREAMGWDSSGVCKWEIYLKNQPSLKSLNLLCVWPSYIEDVLGPFNLYDSASFILPEYFQLLGHGPKLKKQGITLIASTKNLTTLDAALLRPGRFDTIINFSHSFLSSQKSFKASKFNQMFSRKNTNTLKHSPSLGSTPLEWNDKLSLTQNNQFYFSNSSAKEGEPSGSSSGVLKKTQTRRLLNKRRQSGSVFRGKESILFSRENKMCEAMGWDPRKNTDQSLIWETEKLNQFATIKNQFDPQITSLDIPSQSIPIKTFIDVSIFIQYKLWWSFTNGLWFRLNQKGFKSRISNSENLKIFKPSIYDTILILRSKINKIKDLKIPPSLRLEETDRQNLAYIFIGILKMIFFRFFYKVFQFFTMFKIKPTNETKFTTETSINQNSYSVNTLGQEVLISKTIADSYLNKCSDKRLHNYRRKTTQNIRPNINIEHSNMFLKYNRSLLFCTGNFDYKSYSKKDSKMILIKAKPWEEKKQGSWLLSPSNNNGSSKRKSAFLPKATPPEKNVSVFQDMPLNKEVITSSGSTYHGKKTFLFSRENKMCEVVGWNPIKKNKQAKLCFSTQLLSEAIAFLDQSSKIWKPFQAAALKNDNINNVMLTKYNEIYKLKKIKFKQQYFFNLHPFTSFMLKKWPELTKSNKLKRHLKVSLVKKIVPLKNLNRKTIQRSKGEYVRQTNRFSRDSLENSFESFQSSASIIKNSWSSNFNQESLYTQIYKNLYIASLLVPTNISLLQKESVEPLTVDADTFFSTYESYLFKKLSRNSSLNITCLKTDFTLNRNARSAKADRAFVHPSLSDDKLGYDFSDLKNRLNQFKTRNQPCILQTSLQHIRRPCFNHLKHGGLKKIPRKTIVNDKHHNFQTMYKIKADGLEINNNIILLKNLDLASNEKKRHNLVKTHESFFQNYKMCRLDISFFLLIFYTIFFEKIQNKKITLNTIKIFMPYKSLIFSHFLLSKRETYGFSCKNFEILIYNKFKNFLVSRV